MNLGGASDRPKLEEVWMNAMAKDKGEKVAEQPYTITTPFGLIWQYIFG